MKSANSSLRTSLLNAALLTAVAHFPAAHAATLYFDTNGATAGSGNAAGTWDSGTNWTADSAGASATVGWTNGESAVFSAGTDGTAVKAVTLAGAVATPSILLEEVGLVNITGGTIDITGGSVFNSSVLGATTGRSLTWTPVITGTGNLTLAVNGDTSATGGGSNTIFALTGASDFTGDVIITSGVVNANSVLGNASNKVILNGGGLVDPNLNIAFPRNLEIGAAGGVIRNHGNVNNFRLQGTLSGSGELRRTDGGTTILTGSGSGFTGALNLQRGTTQIGDGTQTTNLVPNTTGITLGDASGAATVRYNLDSSFTLTTPVSFPNTGSAFHWQGKDLDDTLSVNTAFGGATAANGTIRVNSGTLSFGSGAVVNAANLQTANTPNANAAAVPGIFAIGDGANVTTRFFDIGQGAGNGGKVEQTGGLVTVASGGTGFRIGHWDNGVSPGSMYNLSGGTLDASITAVNVGWDGQGDMIVGGGAGTATLKAASIAVDANGNSATRNDSFTLSSNGVAEVAGAITTASVDDKFLLNGGTLRAAGNGTWSAPFTLNPATTSTIDIPAGTVTTSTGQITGTGNLNVTGAGNFVVNALTNNFSGSFTRTGGTLSGIGRVTGIPTINGAVSPGATSGSVGVLDFGDLGTTTTFNGPILLDLNASGDPVTSDLVSVFDNVSFGASAVVSPTFSTTPVAATHILAVYAGTRTGAPTLDPGLQVRGLSFAIDNTTQGEVHLNVTGTANPGNLVWGGDGTGNVWNVNSTANFAGGQKFFQYDNVVFDDSGNNAANISVVGNVTPGSLTIDGTKAYTFSGTGSIVGGAPLTKNSTGDLTILNDNKFGTINITAGNLIVGNGGSTGSIGETGGITIPEGSTVEFNRSGNLTYSRAATAGSTGTILKKGSGTLTLGAGATLLPTNLTIDGGTVIAQVASPGGGFGTNRMEGAGIVTVNQGATLIIPQGSNHAFGGSNAAFTESFFINQGTMTINQEQYFNNLTLNGATINGGSDIRSSNASNWLVTGLLPTTIAATVTNQNATNWTIEDVTASSAADLLVSSNVTGGGATNKAGIGTMRFTGANSYTGATNINEGTLQAGSDRALGWGNAIGAADINGTSVAAGATLDIAGVTINEPVTLNNGGLLTNTNLTTTGTLSNGLAGVRVVAAGSGYTAAPTLAFSAGTGAAATAAVSGGAITTITTTAAGTGFTTAPTVTVTGAGIDGSATAVISRLALVGTGNQVGGAGNLSIPAVMVGSGSYSKIGAGSLTIPTGGSSFTGNLSVEAGTVTVTGQGNATTSGLGGLGAGMASRSITLNGGTLAFGINNVLGNGAAAPANLPGIVVNTGATLAANNYNVLGALTLNGGTVTDTRTTAPGGYQGFELKGNVTVGGSSPSLITAAGTFGHHLVGTIGFDVADVATGADLTVATRLLNSSADNASAAAHLTKTGTGTMLMNAANGYTGNTTVTAGVLGGTGSVAGPLIVEAAGTIAPGTSAGTFAAGATTILGTYACEIDGGNTDTLAVTGDLDVSGGTLAVSQLAAATLPNYVIATYSGSLTGAFATVTGLPSGYSLSYATPGQIIITSGGVSDPYSDWASANGIPGAGGSVDSDGDGIANALEFVLGTDPSGPGSDSNANLPKVTTDATYLNFEFRRTDASMSLAASQQPYVEYGSSLSGWTKAVAGAPVATPVVINTVNDGAGAGIDVVTVRIPRALATGSKVFARLRADIP
ncbi:beta strand repeat-containing protein [Luteolibacter luteus]|uniref:Autotransporter domain-containing protein n=1 Tax=Luteolibacter luteus TaxID=2728835 RepID=A0A858RKT0_9BACT|nr:autotransporter-associated beta strand repeat-containing protein [Luteolibacter luteus]QJE97462.1 hypothetical protein HHL09_17280 [Luteolibacter luteus]